MKKAYRVFWKCETASPKKVIVIVIADTIGMALIKFQAKLNALYPSEHITRIEALSEGVCELLDIDRCELDIYSIKTFNR